MTYVVAEIGACHQGDIKHAKRLISAAAEAGCDAVKGQKRDVYVNPPAEWDRPYESPNAFGSTYLEHRRALEFTAEEHLELWKHAALEGLEYFVSVWDLVSLKQMTTLGTVKIPSACATDIELIKACDDAGMDIHLSTGMCTQEQVDAAVAAAGESLSVLYACTSAYPCEFADINLRQMCTFQHRYPGVTIGLSGHHRGIAVDVGAVAMGAGAIERHLTLDRTQKGTDHAAALEPGGMRTLVRDIRALEAAMGDGVKRVMGCEVEVMRKLRKK